MAPKRNKGTKQLADQTSTTTAKNSTASDTSWKARDTIIPTKEKSPDDLEISD